MEVQMRIKFKTEHLKEKKKFNMHFIASKLYCI